VVGGAPVSWACGDGAVEETAARKQLAKKAPQKTLKEKRQEKKAKKKAGGGFDH
jgi:hypothetical protein